MMGCTCTMQESIQPKPPGVLRKPSQNCCAAAWCSPLLIAMPAAASPAAVLSWAGDTHAAPQT
jgi:hypothetical protein